MNEQAYFKWAASVAWRSIWRNRRRTIITISAIAFGMGLAIFFMSLADGVYAQLIDDATRMQGGHFTVEHEEYRDAPAIGLFVDNISPLRKRLEQNEYVSGTKGLVLGQGVARTSNGATGVMVMGVEPGIEQNTSPLAKRIQKGKYLEPSSKGKVVIGIKTAERLKLDVGKKLVITANDANGELVEHLFRVQGIFAMGSDEVDAYLIQIPIAKARKLFGLGEDSATQVAVLLSNPDARAKVMATVEPNLSEDAALRPWEEVLPELANYIRIDRGSNIVFQGILVFLSLFTIFNTLLMSVLERTHEFAVQLALGTSPGLIRLQLLFEAVLIGVLGCIAGIAIGGGFGLWLQKRGLDLSNFYSEGVDVSGFVFDTVVYAKVTPELLTFVSGVIFSATVIISIGTMFQLRKISLADVLR